MLVHTILSVWRKDLCVTRFYVRQLIKTHFKPSSTSLNSNNNLKNVPAEAVMLISLNNFRFVLFCIRNKRFIGVYKQIYKTITDSLNRFQYDRLFVENDVFLYNDVEQRVERVLMKLTEGNLSLYSLLKFDFHF